MAIEEIEHCGMQHSHPEIIKKIEKEMPDEDHLYDLAELFKIFGDSTRIRILYLLLESEMCVCDIATCLSMTQSAISHQLRVLKNADLVRFKRDGKSVIYYLADEHVRMILSCGMEHILEE